MFDSDWLVASGFWRWGTPGFSGGRGATSARGQLKRTPGSRVATNSCRQKRAERFHGNTGRGRDGTLEFGKLLAFGNTEESVKPPGNSLPVWIEVWLLVVYLPRFKVILSPSVQVMIFQSKGSLTGPFILPV